MVTITVKANNKKLKKIKNKLEKNGWKTEDGETFSHPEILEEDEARLALWKLKLLITPTASIFIEKYFPKKERA